MIRHAHQIGGFCIGLLAGAVIMIGVLGGEKKASLEKPPEWAEAIVSKRQRESASKFGVPVAFENSIGMKFVFIPPGEFMMGSERGLLNERPVHKVVIKIPFYMCIHEVRQCDYETVTGKNPSRAKGVELPVQDVSWKDANQFCLELGKRDGRSYRLPSEAEWEYACRAGSTARWCFGSEQGRLCDYAWYSSNSGGELHPGCSKKPNAWGLYDMHGNVWEWCADLYARDWCPASQRKHRNVRGGYYRSTSWATRSAMRLMCYEGEPSCGVGFRVCSLSIRKAD